ncbi:Protein CBG07269 [Caenorhabditis briggsae]|uniref:Protein CBG07269 n=1 Tax=Caenorhabditis briggsae TaxID=6238 RepID=A8X535_CAEBR|nr:Protein CBG07269 [Caenorhabditis briggsae]CAP27746.1 Protein CBG07269 [Caenorhabditis briggsae]
MLKENAMKSRNGSSQQVSGVETKTEEANVGVPNRYGEVVEESVSTFGRRLSWAKLNVLEEKSDEVDFPQKFFRMIWTSIIIRSRNQNTRILSANAITTFKQSDKTHRKTKSKRYERHVMCDNHYSAISLFSISNLDEKKHGSSETTESSETKISILIHLPHAATSICPHRCVHL